MRTPPIPMEPVFEISPPLGAGLAETIDRGPFTLQYSVPLSRSDYDVLDRVAARRPEMRLRVYQSAGQPPVTDLEFLAALTHLRRFQCDVADLHDFDGLRHLEQPSSLALGRTARAQSLAVIGHLDSLRELTVEGHTRDVEVLQSLRSLERLTLRSTTLADLSAIEGLPRLWWLAIKLGGTRDLSATASLPLKYLELWQIRGLTDVAFLADLHSLQYLFLQSLNCLEALPSLARLRELRRVYIEALPSLRSIVALASAPALRELLLVGMPQLDPQSLDPLRGHPTLEAVGIGLGSERRNRAARERLGLPDAAGGQFDFR